MSDDERQLRPAGSTGGVREGLDDEVRSLIDEMGRDACREDEYTDAPLAGRDGAGEPFARVMASRMQRRSFLRGAAASLPLMVAGPAALFSEPAGAHGRHRRGHGRDADSLTFEPLAGSTADRVIVPDGYESYLIARSGEALQPFLPGFTAEDIASGALLGRDAPRRLNSAFGDQCDAVHFFPLLPDGRVGYGRRGRFQRALLCVNHEVTERGLLFPGFDDTTPQAYAAANPRYVRSAQALHGISCIEIVKRRDGRWRLVQGSPYNRRITARTGIPLSGPAEGNPFLRTSEDPDGNRVRGTLNNCAGGKTPWGTYLSAEENTDQYFSNFNDLKAQLAGSADPADVRLLEFHRRLAPEGFAGGGPSVHGWEVRDARFNVPDEPNEPFRHGWIVEVDPYDPTRAPRKRTAMGRCKHECAATAVSDAGQAVVYSGDDARFEYVYKFVSRRAIDRHDRTRNRNLLDRGTLYVARFDDDGTGEWLALDYDSQPALRNATVKTFDDDGKVVGDTGIPLFENQGDVLVNARGAADLLGATPMDRPEDIDADADGGRVYIACTNNTRRTLDAAEGNVDGREVALQPDLQNPRAPNRWGHIVEIVEDGGDNGATTFAWEIFMLCGDPLSDSGFLLSSKDDLDELPLTQDDTWFAGFGNASAISPIGSPDNLAFDEHDNLWIVTDGAQPTGNNNGAFAVPTTGETRGHVRQFLSGPRGAEVCGPEFTPDFDTVFFNIQHPGEGGSIGNAVSNWPSAPSDDAVDPAGPVAQSSLIAVRRHDNKRIGS